MNIKGGSIVLMMIILSFVFTRYYLCNIRGFCNSDSTADMEVSSDSLIKPTTPLLYSWGNLHPNIDSSFFHIIDSMFKSTPSDEALVLVGDYYEAEKSLDSNLGFKRANAIRNLLAEIYDTTRIVARSNNFSIGDTSSEILFAAIHYETEKKIGLKKSDILQQESTLIQTASSPESDKNLTSEPVYLENTPVAARIERGENDMAIYFASGPSDRTITKDMQAAINKIANDLRLTKSSVLISGYADPNGNENVNLGLALKRADLIKQALIRQGIDEKKIIIESLDYKNTGSNGLNQRKVVIKKL